MYMALSEKIISLNFSFQQVTEDYTVVKMNTLSKCTQNTWLKCTQ